MRHRDAAGVYRPWTIATAAGVTAVVAPAVTLGRVAAAMGSVYPIIYMGVVSGVAFVCMGYDKMQARKGAWRVKEGTLWGVALAGGWPGVMVGMHYFQHKTRKRRFQVWFWGIVLAWEGLAWAVWRVMARGW